MADGHLKYDPITGHLVYGGTGHLVWDCDDTGGGGEDCPEDCTGCSSTYTIVVGGATTFAGSLTFEREDCEWNDNGTPSRGVMQCLAEVWRITITSNTDPGSIVWEAPASGCPPTSGWTLVTDDTGTSPSLTVSIP
jgi:hypothetical protein